METGKKGDTKKHQHRTQLTPDVQYATDDEEDSVNYAAAAAVHDWSPVVDEDTDDEGEEAVATAPSTPTNKDIDEVIENIYQRMAQQGITKKGAAANFQQDEVESRQLHQKITDLERETETVSRNNILERLRNRLHHLSKQLARGTLFENIEHRIHGPHGVMAMKKSGEKKVAIYYAKWIYGMIGNWWADDLRLYKGGRRFRKRKTRTVRRRRQQKKRRRRKTKHRRRRHKKTRHKRKTRRRRKRN